jgi:hypothetical protein
MSKFGEVLEALKSNKRARRLGWNGKGMFIFMILGNTVPHEHTQNFKSLSQPIKDYFDSLGKDIEFNPSIAMFTAEGKIQGGWLASQADMLSDDWEILN